jgi:hypothetical protein
MSSHGKDDLSALVEALPYAGDLLAVLVRRALREGEAEAIRNCLKEAFPETRPKLPSRWKPASRIRANRDWDAARRQAADDFLAAGVTLDISDTDEPAAGDPPTDRTPQPVSGSQSHPELLDQMMAIAIAELADARAASAFVPWTARLSASIYDAAKARWSVVSTADDEDEKLRFARMILGSGAHAHDPTTSGLDDDAIRSFSEAVGRRFAAKLAGKPNLEDLVARLDANDTSRAQVALIEAAQGIRVAGIMVAIGGAVAASALVEIALRALL